MDKTVQAIIDGIVNDVRSSIDDTNKEVRYINWALHLEEVRSFSQYRRLNRGAEEAYHETMKPYYWNFLTNKINYSASTMGCINFLKCSLKEFCGVAEWIAKCGIMEFVGDCEYHCRNIMYRLQMLIELGYRRYIKEWPIDEINECLERLRVAPDYKRGEVYCVLSAFYLIESADMTDEEKDAMEEQLCENWDYLIHIYSVIVRSIIGCKLNNYHSIANTVKILKSCHRHIYLFYDALLLRQDFILGKYDGLPPKKKDEALQKFDKHLVYIKEIIENTEQEEDLEKLCGVIFGSEFKEAINRKHFKTYKELEGLAEYWQQEATKLQGMVDELEPLRALCESMRQAMNNSIPMDVIVKTIIGFDDVKMSKLVFQELDWSLDKHPVWSKYRDEMKELIGEKQRGVANLEMRLEELLAKIAKATQATAAASKKAAEMPTMNDNNGLVAGGNIEARVALTNEQVRMLIEGLSLNDKQSNKLLSLTKDGNNNTGRQ